MSNFTMVEVHPGLKRGPITIRPYFDPRVDNMGLQNYGMSLHDGVYQEEQLACIEKNGVTRYLTGLNEFAPEIKLIPDNEVREAKIKEIRKVVAQLERELAANIINPEDEDFWNKVKLLKPDNIDFWGQITIRCSNNAIYLDPSKDPYDLIRLYAIDAGGFSLVARSLEDARARAVSPKFYLDKYEDTAVTKTESKKLRNKALAELQKLFDKSVNKLVYVAKVIDINSVQYKANTPHDIIYDNMDKYINGESFETSSKKAADTFLAVAKEEMETLRLRAMVKDATYLKIIHPKSDGYIYHMKTNSMMGKNASEVVEYLRNPLNDQILGDVMAETEKYFKS